MTNKTSLNRVHRRCVSVNVVDFNVNINVNVNVNGNVHVNVNVPVKVKVKAKAIKVFCRITVLIRLIDGLISLIGGLIKGAKFGSEGGLT